MEYIVVFEGTGNPRGLGKGLRSYQVFDSREEFDEKLARNEFHNAVHSQGVSRREAVRICAQVTLETRLEAAMVSATRSGTFDIAAYERLVRQAYVLEEMKIDGSLFR